MSVTIYGVSYDVMYAREGELTKNGKSYNVPRRHPGYGYHQRVSAEEACLTREAAEKAWRAKIAEEIRELDARRAKLNKKLARGVKDE